MHRTNNIIFVYNFQKHAWLYLDRISLYVHWPFCLSKCPYCDFNSSAIGDVDYDKWFCAYLRDLDFWAEKIGGRALYTVFFGGGTPSLKPPWIVQGIIDKAISLWGTPCEVTLEMNPTSFEAEKLRGFLDAGVNRISVGVQSLDDKILRFLGRNHSASEAIDVIKHVSTLFKRYSFDMIYAHQHHDHPQKWLDELSMAMAIAGEHLSLYQLEYAQGTRFYSDLASGHITKLCDNATAELFIKTSEFMDNLGFSHYEISNFCKDGGESRHNLVYWNYEDYIGIGPGSHSRVTISDIKHTFSFSTNNELWLSCEYGNPAALSAKETLYEILLMGMRTSQGVPIEKIYKYAGRKIIDKILFLKEKGLLDFDEKMIRVSGKNRLLLDSIIEYLL